MILWKILFRNAGAEKLQNFIICCNIQQHFSICGPTRGGGVKLNANYHKSGHLTKHLSTRSHSSWLSRIHSCVTPAGVAFNRPSENEIKANSRNMLNFCLKANLVELFKCLKVCDRKPNLNVNTYKQTNFLRWNISPKFPHLNKLNPFFETLQSFELR